MPKCHHHGQAREQAPVTGMRHPAAPRLRVYRGQLPFNTVCTVWSNKFKEHGCVTTA